MHTWCTRFITCHTKAVAPKSDRHKQAPCRHAGTYCPRDLTLQRGGKHLTLHVDKEGKPRYDAIVQQGRREGQFVQSQFKDLVPLSQRDDIKDRNRSIDRPSEEEVSDTADRTKKAFEQIVQGKIKAAQPKNVPKTGGNTSYLRYTPASQGADGRKQRIIKMTEVVEDPLEPPKHKFKKVPNGPPSPPPPVLRSPPRKVTAQEQKDWMIPPCISNWKNNKGYTIPLDKRLAASGRGLQDVDVNDNFAQFSEALNLADRHAREEVRQRNIMQQKIAAKEKMAREESLRMLAQRAREERAGFSAGRSQSRLEESGGDTLGALNNYGSSESEDEDDGQVAERNRLREERRRERERDLRMSNMGQEQRARAFAKEQNRDISEKVALGLAKPTMSKESMTDARLFNREALSNTFGDEDSYNVYDKPLFQGSTAAAAIYNRPGQGGADDMFGGGTESGINEELNNDRFGMGKTKGFSGSQNQQPRSGPVEFEKDTEDPFAINQFLDEAKRGTKRSGEDDFAYVFNY
ncbi:mRNA splicing protein [Malassezia caprae]|uniref:Pre-mRNA-processing protein 45 n=1 Tax=Malassezia caprae TaxID=1381934 RepID=A0AAF0E454_9BASI|nr:mRNA splicing protein [Malassezia caprae]